MAKTPMRSSDDLAFELRRVVIYLIGIPAVGKYSVAKEIGRLTGAKVVDNQLINLPVFSVLGFDGKDTFPFPAPAWEHIRKIRDAIFSVVKDICPPDESFVFTNVLEHGDPDAAALFSRIEALAHERRSQFFPVWLTCEADELRRRKAAPERSERFKDTDPTNVKRYVEDFKVLRVPHRNGLELDTSKRSVERTAMCILDHIKAKSDSGGTDV